MSMQNVPDDELIDRGEQGLRGQGASIEAMRRLRVAVEDSSGKSDTYSRRMFCLTIILAILTLIQVLAAVPSIEDWYKRYTQAKSDAYLSAD